MLAEDDRGHAQLSAGELAKLFEPMGYQGVAQTFIDRIIGSLQGRARQSADNKSNQGRKRMPVIDADGCPIHVEVEGPSARRC